MTPTARPRQPKRRREGQGVAGHSARADDDKGLVRVAVQQLGRRREIIRLAHFPVDAGEQLSGGE